MKKPTKKTGGKKVEPKQAPEIQELLGRAFADKKGK
jgi:hypothetical protein